MIQVTRTDRLRAAIEAELEDQRPALDAGTPLTSITIFVDLHPDGNVRRVKSRAERERDVCRADRRATSTAERGGDRV